MENIEAGKTLEGKTYEEKYQKWKSLKHRGKKQYDRYKATGDQMCLQEAANCFRDAVSITSLGIGDAAETVERLGNTLLTRFGKFGDRVDLDEAIICQHRALELRPTGHQNRSTSLLNLGNALIARFEQVGDRVDLDQAIIFYQDRLELTPPGNPSRSRSLLNLANALIIRFRQVGDRADLDQAIVYNQDRLILTPPGHPGRDKSISNLAGCLFTRFQRVGDRADLDQAIIYDLGCLELTPPGHPARASSLHYLATSLLTRFQQAKDHADLDQAVIYLQAALELSPPGHPGRSLVLTYLARALATQCGESTPAFIRLDCHTEIIGLLMEATSTVSGGAPHQRLRASLVWIEFAVQWSDPSTLEAYRVALELLETVVATGRSMESRHMRITSEPDIHSLAVDAAAFALDAGEIEVTVELLEQGRSILLALAGKYRTRVDDLSMVNVKLAEEFRSVGQLMEDSVMSPGTRGDSLVENSSRTDEVARYIKLSEQWTEIVDQIRCLKGFESFLRPTPFASLRAAAKKGPIILLNISQRRSDAIIVNSNCKPFVVSLPNATPETLGRMAMGANEKTPSSDFDGLLKETWENLVQPVVKYLQNDLELAKGSRIWWCPTGAACHLPLHAAGIYSKRDQVLPNIYISSYTSTLSALTRARKGIPEAPTATTPNLLVVGQANTPEQVPLPSVTLEIENITSIVPCTTALSGSHSTCEAVLQAMLKHNWIHIACHGHIDQSEPFRSHFSLQDGPMTLLEIAGQNLPNVELAFLAACHSAEGNIDRPDEVLHLTAGLQFAGVRSVLGTLWAMSDEVGPVVSRSFYSNLLRDKGANAGSSAHALHRAVSDLRRMKPKVPSSKWACFVHYGC